MAYKSGTCTGSVVGVSMAGDGDIGIARGSSSHQTEIAKLAAPPVDITGFSSIALFIFVAVAPIMVMLIFFSSFSIMVGIVAGLIMFALCGFAAWNWSKNKLPKHEAAYKAALMKWEHSWICLRCGNKFFIH